MMDGGCCFDMHDWWKPLDVAHYAIAFKHSVCIFYSNNATLQFKLLSIMFSSEDFFCALECVSIKVMSDFSVAEVLSFCAC